MRLRLRDGPVVVRLGAAIVLGVAVAILTGATVGWPYAPAAGWTLAAVTYLSWTWVLVGRMDATQTEKHATRHGGDDSTPRMIELIVVLASLASLAGVGYLLAAESTTGGDLAAGIVGILSVVASWFLVHTVFMLRYARLYYPEQGIDFNQPNIKPTYADFAYLAFTIGMTYQVSDTDLRSQLIRKTVLFQAVVSFLLGAIILAMTLNLVVTIVAH